MLDRLVPDEYVSAFARAVARMGRATHGFGRIILVEHALVARVSGVQKQRFSEERRKLGALDEEAFVGI